MFRIFTTKEFDIDYSKLDGSEQQRVKAIFRKLKEQGADVGKELSGISIFREKKFDGKRLYFLVYEKVETILAIAISDKKAQQATINKILTHIADYQHYVYELLRKKGLI